MDQPKLFYDSYLEALKDDVNALGGSKEVGRWFWPEKSMEAARNMLNDCLNASRRERLTDEQEQLIMRKARLKRGYSAALFFLCDETGFERPAAKNPEDEKAKLQREFVEAIKVAQTLGQKLERLTIPQLQALDGGKS